MKLSADDIDDIRRLLPVHGTRYVMEWLGVNRKTVLKYARSLGIENWPQGNCGRRRPDYLARDVYGMAKVCTGCEQLKDLDEFWPKRSGYMGRHDRCTVCANAQRRAANGMPSADDGLGEHGGCRPLVGPRNAYK